MQTDWLQVNDICYVYKCALGAITKRYIAIKLLMTVGHCTKVYIV